MLSDLVWSGLLVCGLCCAAARSDPPAGDDGLRVDVSTALQVPSEGVIVDWGVGVLEARATSATAEQEPGVAASQDARRRAVDSLGRAATQVLLCERRSVGLAARESAEFARELQLLIDQADIVAEQTEADGRVTAVARLDLWGSPRSLGVLARRLGLVAGYTVATTAPSADSRNRLVVVDARSLGERGLQPCLFPRFFEPEKTAPITLRLPGGSAAAWRGPVRYVRARDELERLLAGRDSTPVRPQAIRGAEGCDLDVPAGSPLGQAEEIYVLY